jgi:hypothetical protein
MRKIILPLLTCLGLAAVALPARADTDLAGAILIGSGVDTGDSENNPYQLQFGGAVELIVNGYVFGFRGIRTLGENIDERCEASGRCDLAVNDLRSMGGDLGYEWEVLVLHIGPRLGIGRVREVDVGFKAPYLDPGGVAEVELGPFLAGVDVRYRFALGEPALSGLLAYAKIGLRF